MEMPKYEFEGIKTPIELPDEYLTVEQIERGYRALVSKGATELDLADPASGRILIQAIIGEDFPNLAQLPASPQNMKKLFDMYAYVGELFTKSMTLGDEVIQEVELKKEETEAKPKAKRGRPLSKSKSSG